MYITSNITHDSVDMLDYCDNRVSIEVFLLIGLNSKSLGIFKAGLMKYDATRFYRTVWTDEKLDIIVQRDLLRTLDDQLRMHLGEQGLVLGEVEALPIAKVRTCGLWGRCWKFIERFL